MKRSGLNFAVAVLIFFSSVVSGQINPQKKKILFVATNVDVLGKNENGSYLVEIAYPFQFFIDKGFDVDIVSPKGGFAPTYPKEYAGPRLGTIQRSELFISKTMHSISPKEVIDSNYAAIFYPGGYGQFADVVNDKEIADIVAKIYERGGVIGSSGHGAASLVNIKLSNGKYLVNGVQMTCFPHWVEIQKMFVSDYGKLIPFDMQEVLSQRGAKVVVCQDQEKGIETCNRIVDSGKRFVTGSYANDALWVAEEIFSLLNPSK